MTLDDRIYCLQNTELPQDLSQKVYEADVAFLQDRIYFATLRVCEVIEECRKRGITLFTPSNFALV